MNVCITIDIKHFRTIRRFLQKTKNRNFDSKVFSILKNEYVQDATRSNRSIICDFAKKKAILISNKLYLIIFLIMYNNFANKFNAKKSQRSRNVCWNFEIRTRYFDFYHTLHFQKKNDFHCVKFTRKSNFTNKMKQNRYEFAKKHENWIIENWKNVIWIDEINVIICKFFISCEKFY